MPNNEFDIKTAIPIEDKGQGQVSKKPEFDVGSALALTEKPVNGETAWESFARSQMHDSLVTEMNRPMTDDEANFITENDKEDPGWIAKIKNSVNAFKVPYAEGVVHFFTNAAQAVARTSPLSRIAGEISPAYKENVLNKWYRPDMSKPFGLTTEAPSQTEIAQKQTLQKEHPVAFTIGQVVAGTAPFMATAPIFPQSLLGTIGTFETVGLLSEFSKQQEDKSLVQLTPAERAEAYIKEATKSGIMGPVWFYTGELNFIGKPFISALTRASARGTATIGLESVFGTRIDEALKQGGIITAVSLMFEAPGLAATALGRGCIKVANARLKEAGKPEGMIEIDLGKLDEASQRIGLFKMARALYDIIKMKVKTAQSPESAQEAKTYSPYLTGKQAPEGAGQEIMVPPAPEGGQTGKAPQGPNLSEKGITEWPKAGGLPVKPEKAPIFYSKMMSVLAEKMPNAAQPEQIYGILKSAGISEEEQKWSGIHDFLYGYMDPTNTPEQAKVNKGELMEFLNENKLAIEETVYGGKADRNLENILKTPEAQKLQKMGFIMEVDPEMPDAIGFRRGQDMKYLTAEDMYYLAADENRGDRKTWNDAAVLAEKVEEYFAQGTPGGTAPTKYSRYTVPGGENYKEMLLQVPTRMIAEMKTKTTRSDRRYNLSDLGDKKDVSVKINDRITLNGQGWEMSWEEIAKRIPHDTFNMLRYLEESKGVLWEKGYVMPYSVGTRVTQNVVIEGKDGLLDIKYVRRPGKLTGPGSTKFYIDGKAKNVFDVIDTYTPPDYPQDRPVGTTRQVKVMRPAGPVFKGGHWDAPNVFAHVRLTDRTDSEGRKILFVEELQSDWMLAKRRDKRDIPEHPAVDRWIEIALKRVLRYAAENGYDMVSWATGAQTAEHYNLAKYVDEIKWNIIENLPRQLESKNGNINIEAYKEGSQLISKTVAINDLEGVIGKDAANKIKTDIENKIKKGTLNEPDLQIGGHWAINLYDRMIPKWMDEYGKKWGAETEVIQIGDKKPGKDNIIAEGEYPVSLAEYVKNVDDIERPDIQRKVKQDLQSALPGGVNIVEFRFSEADSGNISHAVGYFKVKVEGPANKLKSVIGEDDQLIVGNLSSLGQTETMHQQAIALTPEMKQSLLQEGQPIIGREPRYIGKIGYEPKPMQIFRMDEAMKILNTRGEIVTLPKGEEYRTYPVYDSEGHVIPGKIRLQDGKQITVFEGELNKLKGKIIGEGKVAAGGMAHPPAEPEEGDIKVYRGSKIGKAKFAPSSAGKWKDLGFSVSISKEQALKYADGKEDNVIEGYISKDAAIKDLLDMDLDLKEIEAELIKAKEEGYDAAVFKPKDVGEYEFLIFNGKVMKTSGEGAEPPKEPPDTAIGAGPEGEEDPYKEIENYIAQEIEGKKADLKGYLKGKIDPAMKGKGEYADLKHLGWLFAKEGERSYGMDELVSEVAQMGFDVTSEQELRELIKSYFEEDIAKKGQEAYQRSEAQYRKEKKVEYAKISNRAQKDIARAAKLKDIEVKKMVERMGRLLSRRLPASQTKKIVREKTGQTKSGRMVTEEKALTAAFYKAQAASKAGFKAGKVEGMRVAQERVDKRNEIIDQLRQKQKDIQAVKKQIIEYATSMLPLQERGKLLPMIKNAKDQRDVIEAFIRIDERASEVERKGIISDIKDQADKILHAKNISIDYIGKIREALEDISFTKPTEKTMDRLQASYDYLKKEKEAGKDVSMPEYILEKISVLFKKPLADFTRAELLKLRDDLDRFEQLGKTKLKAKKEIYNYEREQRAIEIYAGTVNLDKYRIKLAPIGEELSIHDQLKNKVAQVLGEIQRIDLAISPMDVVFDILDGSKGTYDGPNFRNFKATTDANYGKYLDMKDRYFMPLKDLAGKLELSRGNFERIGVYAALQQEGGLEKLIGSGYSEEEVKAISLTENEMAWYKAARKILDELRQPVEEVVKDIYNEEMGKVENYFSFMTDFEAMNEAEVYKLVGDTADQFGIPIKNPERGFTKTRVGGNQKIMIDAFEIAKRHIDNATYLISMARDNKMLFEIANDPAYGEVAGARGQRIVLEYLDMIARKGGSNGQKAIKILDTLRRNIGVGVLGFKITSTLMQPTSLVDSAAFIGNYAFEGAALITDKNWHDMVLRFPEIRHRMGDDPSFYDTKLLEDMRNKGMLPLEKLDRWAAMATAAGAYKKIMDEAGIPVDFDNINEVARTYAEKIVRRTQSSGMFKDVPASSSRGGLTGNRSVDKALTQFQNFMLNKWSVYRHDVYESGIKNDKADAAFLKIYWLVLATLIGSGIRIGYYKLKDLVFQDQKQKARTIAQIITSEALQTFPIVGNMAAQLATKQEGSLPIPTLSAIMDFYNATRALAWGKKPGTKLKGGIGMASTLGNLLGIPGSTELGSWARRMVKTNTSGKSERYRKIGRF